MSITESSLAMTSDTDTDWPFNRNLRCCRGLFDSGSNRYSPNRFPCFAVSILKISNTVADVLMSTVNSLAPTISRAPPTNFTVTFNCRNSCLDW